MRGRREVLADGNHVDVVGPHVAHGLHDLVVGFTQSDHQPRLGRHARHAQFEVGQQLERVGVIGAGAGFLVEPRHGLEVVVHDIGRGCLEDGQRPVESAAKVGHQHLDPGGRRLRPHLPDAVDEMLGATVAKVVAIDRGDDHIRQTQCGNRAGEIVGLFGIKRVGTAVADIAEGAAPRALVAHDHEGGRAVAEALADVGAGGFFADGVQAMLAQDLLDLGEATGGRGGSHSDPGRLSQHLARRNHLARDAGGLAGALVLGRRVVGRQGGDRGGRADGFGRIGHERWR